MTKNNFRHDGRTRPINDVYAKRWSEIFGEKQDKELAESFKQSKQNKKERLDNELKKENEASIASFFKSCLSPEEQKKLDKVKKTNKANEDNRKDDWIWT
jgi:hypothetical protein